jgi:hypothetical protein
MKRATVVTPEFTEAELAALDPATRAMVLRGQEHARKILRDEKLAASMRQGRPRAPEPRVQFVYDLVDAHHDLARKPSKLRKLDVEGKLGDMTESRFRALVADARKLLGLR